MCHHSPGNQVWQRGGQADAAGQAGVARAPGSGDRVRVVTDDASDGDGVTEYWSSVSSLCDVITLLSKVERPLHFVLIQNKKEGRKENTYQCNAVHDLNWNLGCQLVSTHENGSALPPMEAGLMPL